MTWILLWIVGMIIGGIISLILNHIAAFLISAIGWPILLLVIYSDMYTDEYAKWKKSQEGDHFLFEWTYCKEQYYEKKEKFNNKEYIKMRFKTFLKYFQVNNDRYDLRPGYIVFDDGNSYTNMIILLPRRDLYRYYIYRRNYLQGKQMMYVMKFVQDDINKMTEEAQSYLDRANKMFKSAFGTEQEKK